MNYYERHLGDYAKDTAHLSMLEHGAYNLLLDRYYSTETGIPASQAHRLARARTKEEKQAVDDILAEFFTLSGDVWINKRSDEEIIKAQAKINAAKENGKRGGRPKKEKMGSENETQTKPGGLFVGSENETQTKAHQTPDTRHQVNPEAIASITDSTVVEPENENRLAPVARVCLGLKAMGYSDTNPHDPKLAALIEAGLTPDEILAAGQDGKGKAKGFRWVLATAEGRRRDAANIVPLPDAQTETPGAGRLSLAGQQTQAAADRLLKSMEEEA